MRAIILAAGRGSRMGAMTDSLPKCRTVLHGKELIQWQLDALTGAGLDEIAIIRGYLADSFDIDVSYFENRRWFQTNMVMSLVCAKDWLENDTCITSYSDIVYSSDAVERLVKAEGDIVMSYDPNWKSLWTLRFENPLDDAETFRLEGDRVVEIGNRAETVEEIKGQYMGLVKYTPKGWAQVTKFLSQFNQAEQDNMDMTKLLQGLITTGVMVNGVAIDDEWYEVDSQSDLAKYQQLEVKL